MRNGAYQKAASPTPSRGPAACAAPTRTRRRTRRGRRAVSPRGAGGRRTQLGSCRLRGGLGVGVRVTYTAVARQLCRGRELRGAAASWAAPCPWRSPRLSLDLKRAGRVCATHRRSRPVRRRPHQHLNRLRRRHSRKLNRGRHRVRILRRRRKRHRRRRERHRRSSPRLRRLRRRRRRRRAKSRYGRYFLQSSRCESSPWHCAGRTAHPTSTGKVWKWRMGSYSERGTRRGSGGRPRAFVPSRTR